MAMLALVYESECGPKTLVLVTAIVFLSLCCLFLFISIFLFVFTAV